MNNEEPYRDQAERLKQRIEKINEKVDAKDGLPPREQIHRQKKKKTKWKLKYPVIRLLVLFFILLPIIIFSVISYRDGAKKINGVEKPAEDSVGYETINLENTNEDEGSKAVDSDQSKETITEDNQSEETSKESNDQVEVAETSTDNSVETDNTNENKPDTPVSDNNSEPEKEKVTAETTTSPIDSTVTHTVKPKENLYRIAMRYYHSPKGMDIIMKANNLQSKQISAGQVLKIPLNN
ncbi:LysM peptidoglycan-binding domain-containing protein [Bacillus sp. sid0103]|uniref:LysM peptidoglycan-binding domain-containing protein n=1 Tax=Bacillus sp. sid0103 TaxID=2856337 RepID=UPI001C458521|nr:LysM peptidoglycan-binding domain-containing protein [Bacillus sp. sid0103]MBV7507169.1 LysM peptidoglycan-binding domain-containing protein [Bacillus sp. sid0103]